MRIIHLKGYSEDELHNYRGNIYRNLVECARAVVVAMRNFEIEPVLEENQKYMEFLLNYSVESGPQATIDPEVGVAVSSIWNDPARALLMNRQSEFYLMDSAE